MPLRKNLITLSKMVPRLFYITAIFIALCIASCSHSPPRQAQGYIEGRYTYLTTGVAGVLQDLLVQRGSLVKQGDILLSLEQQPESDLYQAAENNWKEAIAARAAISAKMIYAKITFERHTTLVSQKVIQRSQLDQAKSVYESLRAQLAQADAHVTSQQAALAHAQWATKQKILTAPFDAMVFDVYYQKGEYALANQPILSLLAPKNIKVIFYVNEKALATLKHDGPIRVRSDISSESFTGNISFISPCAEYTPPIIYSNETNEKLLYQIEAELTPNAMYHMHPGQPVIVTY
jgi:HlyD family secretion protein